MSRTPSLRRRLLVGSIGVWVAAAVVIAALAILFASVRREFVTRLRESVAEQRGVESIMTAVYSQMLAAYRQMEAPDLLGAARFDSLGQVAYARLRDYLHQPMSLQARLLVEDINETHRTMEVDAHAALDLLRRRDARAAAARIGAMEARAAELGERMNAFIAQRDTERSALYEAQVARVGQWVAALGVLIVALTASALLFVQAVHRKAVAPLAQLSDAATRLGEGDLTTRVPAQQHEELAAVAQSFNNMASRIHEANVARERSETLYRRLFNEAPIPLYRTSPHGVVLDANPAFVDLLGFASIDDVIGADVRPWYVRGEQRHDFTEVMQLRGTISNQMVELRKAGGDVICVLDTTRRVQDHETGEESYEGGLLDITELRRAQDALRESGERFREMAEHINEAFFVVELPQYRAVYVSPTWTEIWGRPIENAYDLEVWRNTIHVADRALVDASLAKVHGGAADEIVFRIMRPDKSIRWVRSRAFPVRNASGEVCRMVGASEDITELRQAEARFTQAQKMEAVGSLAGGVAHDFNNLLTVIMAATDLELEELPPDSPHRAAFDEIRRAADSAASLTRQLLAFSRRQIVEPVVFSLGEAVADTGKMLRRLIGEHIHLELRLSSDARIRADRGQVEQLLTNLAVNARDAMPKGGRLMLETSTTKLDGEDIALHPDLKPGEYVTLAVSDTGSGMTPEVRARAFEPFFTTKERGHGTGLGLAMCHGIIKQAGGAIDIYSEPDVGTTFRIYLPRVHETAAPDAVPPVPPSPTGAETILFVEDEAAVRRVGARILRGLGYNVLEACDGVEALRTLSAHEGVIHLLFTDVVLPGIGGRELAQRVQAARPDIKVLYASGYTDDVILQDRLANQAITLVQKPYTRATLSAKIRATLDS